LMSFNSLLKRIKRMKTLSHASPAEHEKLENELEDLYDERNFIAIADIASPQRINPQTKIILIILGIIGGVILLGSFLL